jgi:hypothetical protein
LIHGSDCHEATGEDAVSITKWAQRQLREYDTMLKLHGVPPAARTLLQFFMVSMMILFVVGFAGLLIKAWWLLLLALAAWWIIKKR